MFFNRKKLNILKPKTPLEIEEFNLKNSIIFAPKSMFMMSNDVMPFDNNVNTPLWWKDLKKGAGTLSTCFGVMDYIKLGYTIPMWSDIDFILNENTWNCFYDLDTPYGNFGIDEFSYDQTGSCPSTQKRQMEETNFIKLITPWTIKTPKGWSCLILPLNWDSKKDYEVMPGVVNTDNYHQINIIINPLTNKNFKISFKEPLVQVVPFKRNKNLKIQWGDDSVYSILWHKSFGKVFRPIKTKGLYKKNQKYIDMEINNE